jgi:hypothetical protein
VFTATSPFSVGANLPWIRYGGDFGANAWRPQGGLAAGGIAPELRARIDDLRGRGLTAIRWFLFCDGRAGICFADDGTPTGLDDRVLPDLDAAVTFSAEAGVRIMFTLFDFLWCAPRLRERGVDMHGRRRVLADERHRAMLLDRVVAPVLQRYAHHPAVCGWDIINEPEWATAGLGGRSHRRSVPFGVMKTFIADMAALVHRTASQPVTVGLASARWIDLARDCGLDFYQVHWYDHLDATLPNPVTDLRLDRPVILGEYPTNRSNRSPETILQLARDAGYVGAWFWSIQANDDASAYTAGLAGLDRFRSPGSAPGPRNPVL